MRKSLLSFVGVLFILLALVSVTPAQAQTNYTITNASITGGNVVNVGTVETYNVTVNNNTGSSAVLRADIYMSASLGAGLLLEDQITVFHGGSSPNCNDVGEIVRSCTVTVAGGSHSDISLDIIGRDCLANGSIYVNLVVSGVSQDTDSYAFTKSGTTVTCTLDITDVDTSVPRNTTQTDQVFFTAGYGSNTTGYLQFGVSLSNKATLDALPPPDQAYPETFLYRNPGGVGVETCTWGEAGHTSAICDDTQFKTGNEQWIVATYTVGNTVASDYKFVTFFKGGNVVHYQKIIPTSYT